MTAPPSGASRPPRVLAVSSGGGHWAELLRLRPAWDGAEASFVVTDAGYKRDLPAGTPLIIAPDANKDQKLRLAWLALRMAWIVIRLRPDVVISTGAAPGYFAIRFGKLMGARTIWIDSIANADQMSMSGQLARPHSDLWLTQWPHLATEDGPDYAGAVL